MRHITRYGSGGVEDVDDAGDVRGAVEPLHACAMGGSIRLAPVARLARGDAVQPRVRATQRLRLQMIDGRGVATAEGACPAVAREDTWLREAGRLVQPGRGHEPYKPDHPWSGVRAEGQHLVLLFDDGHDLAVQAGRLLEARCPRARPPD